MRLQTVILSQALALGVAALVTAGCGDINQSGLVGLEDCINGVDDNGDALADCEDPQCLGHAACNPYREYACDNNTDDDGDGAIDCADSDCQSHQACNPDQEVACHDGVDNDGDGLIDCRDPDCGEACGENCGDGVDNDGDGLTDCDDPDCWAEGGGCVVEVCDNGYDDDGDGLIDCDDDDCAERPVCDRLERCDNGYDDDGDGLIDCDDDDCVGNPYCLELLCNDSVDNDGNGLTDCDDPVCVGRTGCIPGTSCHPAQELSCGSAVVNSTVGRLNNLDTYACDGETYPGGERYYRFNSYAGNTTTITLGDSSVNQDLQLFVLLADQGTGGCAPTSECVTAALSAGQDQEITLTPDDSSIAFIVVDSRSGLGGDFELQITCLTSTVEICGDGLDNDNDGLVDCADSDCHMDPTCGELACDDSQDNDGDGLTDCWDPDCTPTATCDYWVDGGLDCYANTECLQDPDHFCLMPSNPSYQHGTCSRECSTPAQLGGECDTHGGLIGYCFPEANGGFCIIPCGALFPGHVCPQGWTCLDMDNGSISNPYRGGCVPPP
ncbi:MAG: hypothetical protein ABI333_22545 [bacterium]